MTVHTRQPRAMAHILCVLVAITLQALLTQAAFSAPQKVEEPVVRPGAAAGMGVDSAAVVGQIAPVNDISVVPRSLSPRDNLFASAMSGSVRLAVGASGLILIGDASGKRWQRIDSGTKDNWFAAIDLKDDGFLIAGPAGRLAHINSQGKLEQMTPIDTKSAILSLTRFDDRLYAAGEFGALFISVDEGRSWQAENMPWRLYLQEAWKELGESKPHLFGSCLSDDRRTLYMVGEYGLVLRLHGGIWTQVHGGKVQPAIFACANRGDTLYAVGQRGTLIRSKDQGKSWVDQRFTDADLYAALPTSEGVFFAGDLAAFGACVNECRQIFVPDLPRWTLQLLATGEAGQVLLLGSGLRSVRLP